MNWLDQLAPWAAQLGTNSLKAVPLILLLAALQKWALRWISPRGMKILWFLVLVRLFMPEIAATPASIYNLVPAHQPPPVAAPPASPDFFAKNLNPFRFPDESPLVVPPKFEVIIPVPVPKWSRAEIATAAWLAGVIAMLALIMGQSWRFHRRFARLPACIDPVLLGLLEDCRKETGLDKRVALIVSDAVAVPALHRFFRPRILLPAALATSLDRAQLRCIFQHELAHVRGGDIAVNWVVMLAVAAHWFNPFVWLMARCVAQAREMACDRAVLAQRNDPQVFGETIVRVAENLSRPQIVAGVAAIVESKNALAERIGMLTQKQGRNAWLAASAALLLLGVLFLGSSVKAAMAKTVPGLPGAGVSLEDVLGKTNQVIVGQIFSVKFVGTDSRMDRYRIKINIKRYVIERGHMTGEDMGGEAAEVSVVNSAFLGNIVSGADVLPAVRETIPEDGKDYLFFISTYHEGQPARVLKMVPAGMVMPSATPEFPESSATLEDILGYPTQYIVTGQFMNMRPRFERTWVKDHKIEWMQEYKAVINVKKAVRGKIDPGLIEGDFGYNGSDNLETGTGPRPSPPEMGKDYVVFLSYAGPSENVQERLINGNDLQRNYIFYLSPGRPAETSYKITKILPADALTETKTPVATPPPVIALKPSLPLPGSSPSLELAQAQAETIVMGRVVATTAFFGNNPVVSQAIDIEILKTLRGKAHGAIQYGVPVHIGKEATPEVGKEYLFFLSHYSEVLKIAPPDALSGLPAPVPVSRK